MTKEQLEKAVELHEKIKKVTGQIALIRFGLSRKLDKDNSARESIERGSHYHGDKWTLSKFFTLIFSGRKVNVMPHYEFASAIELDADRELVDLILDYLERKKANLENEFKEVGCE